MYLHLGSSVVIRQRDVVGIFDLDNTTASPAIFSPRPSGPSGW